MRHIGVKIVWLIKNPIFKTIATHTAQELKLPCYVVGGYVRDMLF